MKLLNVTFTTLLDSTGEAAEAWDVQIYPTSYLIDADGRMRYVAYGPVDWDSDDIIRRIEALLPAALGRPSGRRRRIKPGRNVSVCGTWCVR